MMDVQAQIAELQRIARELEETDKQMDEAIVTLDLILWHIELSHP